MVSTNEQHNQSKNRPLTDAFKNADQFSRYTNKMHEKIIHQEGWRIARINIAEGCNETGVFNHWTF